MKTTKHTILILLNFLVISVISFSCNKGAFKTTPLDPLNPDSYEPKDTLVSIPDFKVYNWIRYNNTPGMNTYNQNTNQITVDTKNLSNYGIHSSFFIVADPWLLDDAPNGGDKVSIINELKFGNMAVLTQQYPDWYIQLDEEGWDKNEPAGNWYPMEDRKDSLLKSIRMFKKYNTKNKIGFYAQLPLNRYSKPFNSGDLATWKANNTIFAPVYDSVDVFYPNAYSQQTRWSDGSYLVWKENIVESLNEIKRLDKTGEKPIIVGLRFDDEGVFIEPEFVSYQLETLFALTQEVKGLKGVFIWSSNKDADGKYISFNQDMPWFKPLIQFIKKHNIQ